MNNLLCCILFCFTASSLVNADCSTAPSVPNATINEQHQCGDITIRCDKGFIMEQVTECKDGKWKYQKPFCKPQECDYSFTNTYVGFDSVGYFANQNEAECDKKCNDNTECFTTFLDEYGYCDLYPAPTISISQPTDLDQCITKCTKMNECLMVYHWGSTRGENDQRCYMFNDTLINLPGEYFWVGEGNDDAIVAEKYCL